MPTFRFALRTDKALDAVKAWLDAKGVAGFGVREIGAENHEHWHWYCESDQLSKLSQVRTSLTRACPDLKGNGAYSVKPCDEDYVKYLRYICKGEEKGAGAQCVWRYGLPWTDARLEELHQEYWEANRAVKKRKVGSIVQEVYDACVAKSLKWDDEREIGKTYLRVLVDGGKGINFFSIKSNIRLIQIKLCPTDEAFDCISDRLFIS